MSSPYDGGVGRWEPGTRERLERAALELFVEQGFAETTVPQITARAGLTTRTFFRHYADKREVFFAGEDEVLASVAGHLATADLSDGALPRLLADLPGVALALFGDRREELRLRRGLVASDEGLVERELRKRAALTATVRRGLLDHGVAREEAALAAGITTALMHTAVQAWLDGAEGTIDVVVRRTTSQLVDQLAKSRTSLS